MIGTIWTHLKRGTSYEIVGIASALHGAELKDDDVGFLFVLRARHDRFVEVVIRPQHMPFTAISVVNDIVFKIPLLVQISCTEPDQNTSWVVYRSLDTNDFYARPKDEFTPDRFVQHT